VSSSARRGRTERRQKERELKKLIEQRQQLATASPGGAPERPIGVASAAVVELRARAQPCVQCGGEVEVTAHEARVHDGTALRRVTVQCKGCHAPRHLWFAIETPRPS
jgi:hypothetical protein